MKLDLWLDFDGVIVDSIGAYCEVYKAIYSGNQEYKKPNPQAVWRFDMQDQCPLVTDIQAMFEHPAFFQKLGFYDKDTRWVLATLSDTFNMHIVSLGSTKNLIQKAWWIDENLPFVKNVVLMNHGNFTGKKAINMEHGIFVDDHEANLNSSNAAIKMCFGRHAQWNCNWYGYHSPNWNDLNAALEWTRERMEPVVSLIKEAKG